MFGCSSSSPLPSPLLSMRNIYTDTVGVEAKLSRHCQFSCSCTSNSGRSIFWCSTQYQLGSSSVISLQVVVCKAVKCLSRPSIHTRFILCTASSMLSLMISKDQTQCVPYGMHLSTVWHVPYAPVAYMSASCNN